jgi:two-component system sensor histidine kinase/response regulator
MTAHALQEVREECLAVGMNDYVTKPIEKGWVFSVLSRWVKPRSLVRDSKTAKVYEGAQDQTFGSAFSEILPGIDITSGLKRLGGNRRLFVKLLKEFCRDYASVTEDIKSALSKKDIEAAMRLVHAVRGVAANLSALHLYEAAFELNKGIRQQPPPENLESLLKTFEQAFSQIAESVQGIDVTD